MSPKLEAVMKELRALDVSPAVMKMVADSAAHDEDAPAIPAGIVKKMRATASLDRRAVLVWCTNGRYKVFSHDGHEALRDSARRNKPWLLTKAVQKLKN